jgi:alkylhydroperoxidase family enzyme
MRLEPIERPSSLLGRLMSFGMRRQLGKVITPARVFYNRVPRMWNVSWALLRLDLQGLKLPHELALLIKTHVAMLNGCGFCRDIARALAVQQRLGREKFDALADWRESDVFDDRERAALAYAEEATRERVVSDETFGTLRKRFSEREIAEITIVNAVENFYNFLNVPLEIPDDGLEAIAAKRHASVVARGA